VDNVLLIYFKSYQITMQTVFANIKYIKEDDISPNTEIRRGIFALWAVKYKTVNLENRN